VPRITLPRWITIIAVLGGLAIGCFAASVVVRDPSSDGAWVAVVLGLSIVVWGVAFAYLDDGPDTDEPDTTAVDSVPRVHRDRVHRLLRTALTVTVFTAIYAITRWHQVPVGWALGGAVIATGLPVLNRALDRRIARDELGEGAAD
jgi:4-hydroxybenzoate polyprenyltransferase